MRLKKRLKSYSTAVITLLLCLVITACGIDCTSQLLVDDDFAGMRMFQLSLDSESLSKVKGGSQAVADLLTDLPEFLSVENTQATENSFSTDLSFSFDSLDDYIDKCTSLIKLGSQQVNPQVEYSFETDNPFVQELSFYESFGPKELLDFLADKALAAGILPDNTSKSDVWASVTNELVLNHGEPVALSKSYDREGFQISDDQYARFDGIYQVTSVDSLDSYSRYYIFDLPDTISEERAEDISQELLFIATENGLIYFSDETMDTAGVPETVKNIISNHTYGKFHALGKQGLSQDELIELTKQVYRTDNYQLEQESQKAPSRDDCLKLNIKESCSLDSFVPSRIAGENNPLTLTSFWLSDTGLTEEGKRAHLTNYQGKTGECSLLIAMPFQEIAVETKAEATDKLSRTIRYVLHPDYLEEQLTGLRKYYDRLAGNEESEAANQDQETEGGSDKKLIPIEFNYEEEEAADTVTVTVSYAGRLLGPEDRIKLQRAVDTSVAYDYSAASSEFQDQCRSDFLDFASKKIAALSGKKIDAKKLSDSEFYEISEYYFENEFEDDESLGLATSYQTQEKYKDSFDYKTSRIFPGSYISTSVRNNLFSKKTVYSEYLSLGYPHGAMFDYRLTGGMLVSLRDLNFGQLSAEPSAEPMDEPEAAESQDIEETQEETTASPTRTDSGAGILKRGSELEVNIQLSSINVLTIGLLLAGLVLIVVIVLLLVKLIKKRKKAGKRKPAQPLIKQQPPQAQAGQAGTAFGGTPVFVEEEAKRETVDQQASQTQTQTQDPVPQPHPVPEPQPVSEPQAVPQSKDQPSPVQAEPEQAMPEVQQPTPFSQKVQPELPVEKTYYQGNIFQDQADD